jgi:hypothetical protein
MAARARCPGCSKRTTERGQAQKRNTKNIIQERLERLRKLVIKKGSRLEVKGTGIKAARIKKPSKSAFENQKDRKIS